MKVEIKCEGSRRVKLEALTPLQGDLKDLSDENYNKLKTQILDLGFSAPFFCWTKQDGKPREQVDMLDGHQRHKTLLRMQEEDIEMPETFPIVDVDASSYVEAKKKVLAISSNYGTMTVDGLKNFMKDIDIKIDEIVDSFTFDAIDFGDLSGPEVEQLPPGNDDEFVVDMAPDPVTKKGDVWILGDHRIMCGDSTMIDDVEKLMNREKADMVFTDPPYNVTMGSNTHEKFKQREIKNDSMTKEDFSDFCDGFIGIIPIVTSGLIYLWGAQGPEGREVFTKLDTSFHWSSTVIWKKDVFVLGRAKYHNRYEPCWFGWVADGKSFCDDRSLDNVWEFERPKSSKLHPTMKPIEMIEYGLGHTRAKSVCDLFLGSGSTLIACENTNRKCFGMELDEKYCDVTIKRWQHLTEKKAFLESTGNTFDELR